MLNKNYIGYDKNKYSDIGAFYLSQINTKCLKSL